MTKPEIENILNKIFQAVFAVDCPWDIDETEQRLAFDLNLPRKVRDHFTGEETWTAVTNAKDFITQENMEKYDSEHDWMQKKADFKDIGDIVKAWNKVNLLTTDRISDSTNVCKSDLIYRAENVYHSVNCNDGKNILMCNSCGNGIEYLLASERTGHSSFVFARQIQLIVATPSWWHIATKLSILSLFKTVLICMNACSAPISLVRNTVSPICNSTSPNITQLNKL